MYSCVCVVLPPHTRRIQKNISIPTVLRNTSIVVLLQGFPPRCSSTGAVLFVRLMNLTRRRWKRLHRRRMLSGLIINDDQLRSRVGTGCCAAAALLGRFVCEYLLQARRHVFEPPLRIRERHFLFLRHGPRPHDLLFFLAGCRCLAPRFRSEYETFEAALLLLLTVLLLVRLLLHVVDGASSVVVDVAASAGIAC